MSPTSGPGSSHRPARHAETIRIRFSVNVPVLSVQITEVEPRVSTADSRLTSAPDRASDRTPTANARVMVGSSPSGTLATNRPTAKIPASSTVSPASMPNGMNRMPIATATQT